MAAERTPEQRPRTPHEQAMVDRARANAELMRQTYESLAAHKRGEKGTPGRQVHEEARRRRADL